MKTNRIGTGLSQIAIFTALFLCIHSTLVSAAAIDKKLTKIVSMESQWRFKRTITINNTGAMVSNAVIEIKFDNSNFDYSKVKADGTDIRFSTTAGKLNDEGLSYWTEQWNDNGVTRIWVKVPALPANARSSIYMYYGSLKAKNISNGTSTFLFFDDFDDGDFSRNWINSSVGEVVESGGSLKLKESDGQDGIIEANFEVTGNLIIRTLYQRGGADGHWVRAGVGGWNKWLCVGDHTHEAASGTNYVMLFDSASVTSLKSAPLVKAANTVITDQWRRLAYWCDGKSLKGMQDDVTVEWPAAKASSKLALRTLDNDSWDHFAYITVSPYLNEGSKVTLGPQQDTATK